MGTPVKHTDICIRGQVFPTIRAAATYHGVTYQAVKWAMLNGKLDRVGLGLGRPATPMRVRIRDMVFETVEEAARHLGLKPNTVRTALWRGDGDRLGLPRRFPGAAKPCTIHGITWPSRTAACRELGLSHGFLWHVEHGGGRKARETLLGRVLAYRARHEERAAVAANLVDRVHNNSGAGKTARAGTECRTKRAA